MIARFDYYNRFVDPELTLCNPGSTVIADGLLSRGIGSLTSTEAVENIFNFNAPSELNFRVYKCPDNDDDESKQVSIIFDNIQCKRLLFQSDVGFFEIDEVTKHEDSNGYYKDVSAKSIEVEFKHWCIPFVEGTVSFRDLLNTIVHSAPLWQVGSNIDSSLLNRYRTFEDVDTNKNCLSFMIEEMQDAYECIIVFDIINRVVYAYDRDTYIKDTGVYISNEDLVSSCAVEDNSDELYTALSVCGDGEISIHPLNPLGTKVIYNFDSYKEWMSANLQNAVSEWSDQIAYHEILRDEPPEDVESKTYAEASMSYYECMEKYNELEMELELIKLRRDTYQKCLDNIENSINNRVNIGVILSLVDSAVNTG